MNNRKLMRFACVSIISLAVIIRLMLLLSCLMIGVPFHAKIPGTSIIKDVESVTSSEFVDKYFGGGMGYTDWDTYDPPVAGSVINVTCSVNSLPGSDPHVMSLYIFKAGMESYSTPVAVLQSHSSCPGYYEFTGQFPEIMNTGLYTFVIVNELCVVDTVFTYPICSLASESKVVHSEMVSAKPVIYMYPEEDTEAFVSLDYNGELTCTYPSYNDDYGWHVMAHPGGVITDLEGGRDYDYLYWEGLTTEIFDFDQAVCVRGCDTASFLEEYLEASGLTYSEIDDFITYWLPKMECNEYNLISFPVSEYEEIAELNVEPEPDTVIRVYMVFTPLDEEVYIPEEQQLQMPTPVERTGFTLVEWGGSEI